MSSLAHKLESTSNFPKKREVIDGIPVMMAPGKFVHANINVRIFRKFILQQHSSKSKCEVFMENILVKLDENNLFIPDITIICDLSKITEDGIEGAPDLVIETLSPSTAKNDRTKKSGHMQMQA